MHIPVYLHSIIFSHTIGVQAFTFYLELINTYDIYHLLPYLNILVNGLCNILNHIVRTLLVFNIIDITNHQSSIVVVTSSSYFI